MARLRLSLAVLHCSTANDKRKQFTIYEGGPLDAVQGSEAAPLIAVPNDLDTGLFWPAADQFAVSAGNRRVLWISNNQFISPNTDSDTTGTAANVFCGTGGRLQRSTSARKYKSRINYNVDYLAGLELRPTKHYRPDDKAWYFGFIADDLGKQHKLLGVWRDGEIEDYDQRAVMAVMAAKINRLEKRLQEPTE